MWAFLLRGGGREGGSLEWCACILLYTEKTTVAVDPLRLQSIYCTHQCVGLSRVCARRGSAWQHRGVQGLSRRSGSAWTPPFAQGCALGKPPCHTSVCTQHQVARSQAQEGAPLLAGCARLTLGAACSRLRRFHRSCRFPSPPRPPPPRSCNHVPGVRLRA